MGVYPRSHCCSSYGKFRHSGKGVLYPLYAQFYLPRPSGHLLVQGQGHCIHQVGPSGLHQVLVLLRLLQNHLMEVLQGGNQLLHRFGVCGYVYRRGDNIVGRLPHVHVVVGMDGILRVLVPREDFVGSGCDYLVGVHVGGCSGARLEYVDGELVVEFAVRHLLRRLHYHISQFRVQIAQFLIHLCSRILYESQGFYERSGESNSADGEVLYCPLGLSTPVGILRDLNLSQRIFFYSVFTHNKILMPEYLIIQVVNGRIGV